MCRIYGQDNCSCVICTSAFHGGRMPILHRYLDVTLLGSLIDIRSARHLDFRSITCRSHCRGAKIGYVQDVRADNCSCVICTSAFHGGRMPILQEQKSVMYRMYGMPILQEQKSVKSHFWSGFVFRILAPSFTHRHRKSQPSLPPCLYLCSSVLTQALLFWLFARCQRPSDNALFPSSVRSLLPDYPIVLRSGCHRLG